MEYQAYIWSLSSGAGGDPLQALQRWYSKNPATAGNFVAYNSPEFDRLLDVDKWWALDVAQLTSRDVSITWNYQEAFRQLDDALGVPAEVRVEARSHDVSRGRDAAVRVDWRDAERLYRGWYHVAKITSLDPTKKIYLHRTGNYMCALGPRKSDDLGDGNCPGPTYLDHNPNTSDEWSVIDELTIDVPLQ